MRLMAVLLSGCFVLHAPFSPGQSSLPDAPKPKPIVYKVGGDVTSPKVIFAVDPEFTEEAHKHRVQGIVTLSVVVDEHGIPQQVKVAQSLATKVDPKYRAEARDLDEKAVEAVRQYRFKPGLLKGKPVAVAMELEVNFQLI